ncbi:MAG: AraC family transcriptional regulator, partial [Clostridia bacterium]|nr:AraC family transcriptional regulator [Clostridia bacterium]
EVAQSVGFDDALYFSKIFKAKYGVPPSKYVSID